MSAVLMECGHTANATREGEPACAICAPKPEAYAVQEEAFDLTGRTAVCTCKKTRPSSLSLPFFEFRGEGSRIAQEGCANCGYSEVAHSYGGNYAQSEKKNPHLCLNRGLAFEPRGAMEFDTFYCGHAGWN